MTDGEPPTQRARRRASRAPGPAGGEATAATAVRVETPAEPFKRATVPLGRRTPPPRRPANRHLTGLISLSVGLVAIAVLAVSVVALWLQQRQADAKQALDQRFVDTATQTVVNMFSYNPDNIDESVNRSVDGTSGPLRGMLSANAENIKALYRDTSATSEAVINGAALERIDSLSDSASVASVLVAVRVTVTDIDGVNKPSMPYRMRVVVHEDDAGRMTGYDLKYPDGGN